MVHQAVRKHSWLMKLMLLCGSLVLTFVAAELTLRVLGVHHPRVARVDPERGFAYRPGIKYHYDTEGSAEVSINSAGFRDREWQSEKRPGAYRIAVLGDSYVEAPQVEREDRFTELLEERLSASPCLGRPVEVLNFGISGYGTAQELMTLRQCVWQSQPDLVLLAVLTGNDLRDNCACLLRESDRPYFVFRDGELVFDDSFRQSPDFVQTWWKRLAHGLVDRSRLFQLAYRSYRGVQARREVERLQARDGEAPLELGLDNMVYVEPTTADWNEAWQITEALLETMHKEVEAKGASFLVVTLTNGSQVHPDPMVRQETAHKLGVTTLTYPDDRIKRAGEQQEYLVLNLVRPFQEYAEKNQVFLHGFSKTSPGSGHWNQSGHRLAADLIADELCRIQALVGVESAPD